MTPADAFRQGILHPSALYLDAEMWTAGTLRLRSLPGVIECRERGIHRFRIVLPRFVAPPNRWARVKETLIRRIPLNDISHLASETLGGFVAVSRNDEGWKEWIDAHWRHYVENHRDNPPKALSFSDRVEVFGGPDLEAGNGVGLWRNGILVAFSSVRFGEGSAETGEAGWMAAFGVEQANALSAVMAWTLLRARQLQMTHIEVEADDTDRLLWEQVLSLPTTLDEIFTTWEYVI